jgi:CheY-like chemotaxis protein
VLLDMRLPDGSGVALAAEMTQAGEREPPILVALTGAVEPQQRGAALAAGCAAAVSKPYPVASLCDLLIAQLRRRAAQPASGTEHRPVITSSHGGGGHGSHGGGGHGSHGGGGHGSHGSGGHDSDGSCGARQPGGAARQVATAAAVRHGPDLSWSGL